MIRSMTAFGGTEARTENGNITVEIRSLNHRYRDISFRMPRYLTSVEGRMKRLISDRVSRGLLEVSINIKHDKVPHTELRLNLSLCNSYYLLVKEIKETLKIEGPISLDTILAREGVIVSEDCEIDPDQFTGDLLICLEKALDHLCEMKEKEGDTLCRDLLGRLGKIEKELDKIRAKADALCLAYHDQLKERIMKLAENVTEPDPNRLIQEAAFLAAKSDITEELVRLASHLTQFRSTIESDDPSGRSLNFLLQEMHREANTLASKIGDAGMSHIVVRIKSELEKIREQVQNVE